MEEVVEEEHVSHHSRKMWHIKNTSPIPTAHSENKTHIKFNVSLHDGNIKQKVNMSVFLYETPSDESTNNLMCTYHSPAYKAFR
jgi:hypothetical protein